MPRFIIEETRIVFLQVIVEAENEEAAREGWLESTIDELERHEDVQDSHGLHVQPA